MKILIRGTNWIGDAVMTIPAITKLRRLFPDAQLVLLAPESTIGIFRESALVDEVIASGSVFQQAAVIRSRKFDIAVAFPNSFSTALAMRLGGAKRRFGYAAPSRSILLSEAIAVPD